MKGWLSVSRDKEGLISIGRYVQLKFLSSKIVFHCEFVKNIRQPKTAAPNLPVVQDNLQAHEGKRKYYTEILYRKIQSDTNIHSSLRKNKSENAGQKLCRYHSIGFRLVLIYYLGLFVYSFRV